MTPTVAASITLRLVDTCERLGVARAALLQEVGLDEPRPQDRIAAEDHMRIWEVAMRMTGDPALPMHYARATRVDHYGVLGFACKTSHDLGEAIHRLGRYVRVAADGLEVAAERRSSEEVLWIHREGPAELALGLRAATESTMAELWVEICEIAGTGLPLREARFAHREPADVSGHEALFGCPVRFGAGEDALAFAPGTFATPLEKADPAMSAFLLGHLDAMAPEQSWTQQTARQVEMRLPSGPVTLEAIAKLLGSSARSLQRHLAEEQTTFREVVEQTRIRRATSMLDAHRDSLAEIAFVLGFSEPSAFSRWFKKATSQTPGQFRQRHQRSRH